MGCFLSASLKKDVIEALQCMKNHKMWRIMRGNDITRLSSPSGKDVMFYAAEMIPKLKSRTQKSGGADAGSQPGEGGKKGKKKKK